MTTLLLAVLVSSLVGSLHCVGMCGGIVTLCVGGRPVDRRRGILAQVLYNAGRVVTYTTLGAVSGSVGAAMDLGGSALGWSRVATCIAGGAMILLGGAAFLGSLGVKLRCMSVPVNIQRIFQQGLAAVRRLPTGVQPLLIGLLTGFLPCGWLYAFVIGAAGTGSAAMGALTMIAFWAGTLPAMLCTGLSVQWLASKFRRHVPRLTAAAVVIIGCITITGRLSVPAYAEMNRTHAVESDVVEHVKSLDVKTIPCCRDHS